LSSDGFALPEQAAYSAGIFSRGYCRGYNYYFAGLDFAYFLPPKPVQIFTFSLRNF
jgi:hypothetical protein